VISRFLLLLLTNIAIMTVAGIVIPLLGIDSILGLDGQTTYLLLFSAVMGFGGSFVSLAMSKFLAKRQMRVKVIGTPENETERWLQQTVHRQAQRRNIGLPEVGIFDSPSPNAFATGMSKNSALIAVSTGLLRSMSKDEVEAVLGHEVSHAANGDMVTMGLLQGVMNTFVFFFSYILGNMIDSAISGDRNNRGPGFGYYIGTIVGNVLFGFLAGMVTAWFSRRREYRADAGGAKLAGKQGMINALKALQRNAGPSSGLPQKMAAFGITPGKAMSLLSTHPPLEVRIAALEKMTTVS